jgi:transposase
MVTWLRSSSTKNREQVISRILPLAARALQVWLQDAQTSGLKAFERIARTLARWRPVVLAYWSYPLTNAMVEGKHNRVKVLKRTAHGYRNDRTFSLRF